jgi:CubicO group peptidase (beta-lactamase class C family)
MTTKARGFKGGLLSSFRFPFGLRDVNTREPVNADTVFQLASLSKPIGSTLVAQLVLTRE